MLNRNRFHRQASVDILKILDLGGRDALVRGRNLEHASDPIFKLQDFHQRFVATSNFRWKKPLHISSEAESSEKP